MIMNFVIFHTSQALSIRPKKPVSRGHSNTLTVSPLIREKQFVFSSPK
jgi:hypothetical protein